MAMWNQLKQKSQDMSSQLKTKTGQLKNKNFSEASMAMCALIAAADGSIDAEERRKVAGLIASNDILGIFPPDELRQRFDHYCQKLSQDYDFGKVEALQALGKVKKKDVEARAVIQIGIIIGGADGTFDEHEKRAVKEACHAVGIDPAEFEL
ncbi:MAG: tellurite resistance TerB family protein [Sporichthyaceae bacterium]